VYRNLKVPKDEGMRGQPAAYFKMSLTICKCFTWQSAEVVGFENLVKNTEE